MSPLAITACFVAAAWLLLFVLYFIEGGKR